MTTTTNTTASFITEPALFVQNLVHMLCDDIDADHFADRFGTTINHPLTGSEINGVNPGQLLMNTITY